MDKQYDGLGVVTPRPVALGVVTPSPAMGQAREGAQVELHEVHQPEHRSLWHVAAEASIYTVGTACAASMTPGVAGRRFVTVLCEHMLCSHSC